MVTPRAQFSRMSCGRCSLFGKTADATSSDLKGGR
jgi:hypothetical protein